MARPKQTRRSVATSIVMIGVVLALIAGIATWVALGAGGGERSRFVTGVASAGSVSETRVLVGKLSRENQVSAAFPAAGTVTKVSVRLGDQVSAGQELAAVDPAPLRAALLEAEAGLAQARAQLSADKAATTSGSSGISLPTQSGTGGQTGGSAAISVKALMSPVNAALAAVQGAVADQQKACAPLWAATPPTPSASPSVTPSVSTTPTTTTTPTTSVSGTPTVSPTSTPSTSVSATTTPTTTISPTVTPTVSVSVPPAPGVTPAQFAACSAALGELARAEGMAAQALG
ncbi:MAG: biotin/lipoyl-binding protein, partial [Micropruina sp.]